MSVVAVRRGQAWGMHPQQISFFNDGGVKTQSGTYDLGTLTLYRDTVLPSADLVGFPINMKAQFYDYLDIPADWWTCFDEAGTLGCDRHLQLVDYNPENPGPDGRDATPFPDRVVTMFALLNPLIPATQRGNVYIYYGNEPDISKDGIYAWNGTDAEWAERQAEVAAQAISHGYKWGIGQYADIARNIEVLPGLIAALNARGITNHNEGSLAGHLYGTTGDPILIRGFKKCARAVGWTGRINLTECMISVDADSQTNQQVNRWTYHAGHMAAEQGVGLCWFMLADMEGSFATAMIEAIRDQRLGLGPRSYQYHRINSQQGVAIKAARMARMALDPNSHDWQSSPKAIQAYQDALTELADAVAYAKQYRRGDER